MIISVYRKDTKSKLPLMKKTVLIYQAAIGNISILTEVSSKQEGWSISQNFLDIFKISFLCEFHPPGNHQCFKISRIKNPVLCELLTGVF